MKRTPPDDRQGRAAVAFQAHLRYPGAGAAIAITVSNLSAGGIGGDCEEGVRLSAPVTVALPGIGGVAGRIAWASGVRFGIAFDQPIDLQMVMQALRTPYRERQEEPSGSAGGSRWRAGGRARKIPILSASLIRAAPGRSGD